MIDALEQAIPSFDGDRARGRCFAHTINLIVKSILREFESKKKHGLATNDSGIEIPDTVHDDSGVEIVDANESGGGEFKGGDADDFGDWRDERSAMTKTELERLDSSVQPLQGMLGKVSNLVGLGVGYIY